MFHRVKPEAQQETSTPENSGAEIRNFQASAAERAAPERETPPARPAIQPQQKAKQEKETRTMNDQSRDHDDQNEEQSTQETRRLNIPAASPYQQRPGQQSAMRAAGGYPGAYPGSSYAAAVQRPEAGAADRTLTIGSGITMSGEIESCDYLLVEGTVEASLKGASVLEIAESGVFYGTVEIEEATIAGRFEGDITVNGRLTIRSSGTITGSIAYKELEVESGAVIDGRLTPVSATQAERKAPAASSNKPKVSPAPVAKAKSMKDEQPTAANSDGELFSSKAAAAAE